MRRRAEIIVLSVALLGVFGLMGMIAVPAVFAKAHCPSGVSLLVADANQAPRYPTLLDHVRPADSVCVELD